MLKTPFANVYARTIDWPEDQTEAAAQQAEGTGSGAGGDSSKHLWEESWDDDDTSDDFSQQLKYGYPTTPDPCGGSPATIVYKSQATNGDTALTYDSTGRS